LEAVADGKKSRTIERRTAPHPQNTDDDFSTDIEPTHHNALVEHVS